MIFDPNKTAIFNLDLYPIFGKSETGLKILMLKHFQDGRHASEFMEALIAYKFSDNIIKSKNGSSYDLLSSDGKYYEVKCITSKGLKINPSCQIGVGRKYDGVSAIKYIKAKDGFFHPDITKLRRSAEALDTNFVDLTNQRNIYVSHFFIPVYFIKQELDGNPDIIIQNKPYKSHRCAYCNDNEYIDKKDANLNYKKAIDKILKILNIRKHKNLL